MNYLATGEQLTDIADAIRAKTGGSEGLEFPTDFVSEIGTLTDLSTLVVKTLTLTATVGSPVTITSKSFTTISLSGSVPDDIALNGFIGFSSVSGGSTSLRKFMSKPTISSTGISATMTLFNLTNNSITLSNGTTLSADFYYYAYPADES